MGLFDTRLTFRPTQYQEAETFWEMQQKAHWLHHEVQMGSDIFDWKEKLSDTEKYIIGSILKSFTTAEVIVGDYWSNVVANRFKVPEIQAMANTFAGFETVHQYAYAYLNDTLGLTDYAAFLTDPASKAKIDRILSIRGKSKKDLMRSIAVFSGFVEGVSLFSSFSILLSFSQRNLLKGVGQIIAWSIRDEQLHSNAGCWLFNEMKKEYPELFDEEMKQYIIDAAKTTIELEDNFIDQAFAQGDLPNLTKKDLKQYMRHRANQKLQQIGMKKHWKNIDKESIDRMSWFGVLSGGVEQADFFAARTTAYSKAVLQFDNVFDDTKEDVGEDVSTDQEISVASSPIRDNIIETIQQISA